MLPPDPERELRELPADDLAGALVAADRWALWRTLARGLGHQLANAAQMLALDPAPKHAREEAVERLHTAIARLGEVHRPEAEGPVIVADVLAAVQAAQRLQSAWPATELAIEPGHALPPVGMRAGDLAHALLALVTYAKRGAGDARARIVVTTSARDGGVVIRVSGAAAPEERAARAFEPGAIGADRPGAGLWAARHLARAAGGDLVADDAPGAWSLVLPAWRRPRA